MAYRKDKDLAFLSQCEDRELNDLVYCLTHDSDSETRFTEELTSNKQYKKHYPHHSKYWQEIAAEIQCFGANSIMTFFRFGKGVLYEEVLTDVCEKLVENFKSKNLTVEEMENQLLMSILRKSISEMSESEIRALGKDLKVDSFNSLTPEILLGLAQTIFKIGGFKSYQLTLILANAVSKAIFAKGLGLAANAGIARVAGVLAGPIGLAITGIWTIVDLAGPAYRVTIPAVINIAVLRKKYQLSVEELERAREEAFDIDTL